jgi:hypothetical protein
MTLATFTASGTFTPPTGVTSVDVLIVGGGGGGGAGAGTGPGGGGGAGGVQWFTGVAVTPGSGVAVTVGAGGLAVSAAPGASGGSSSFAAPGGTLTSLGGGGGGRFTGPSAGVAGASGGGGAAVGSGAAALGGAGTAGQGNAGGSGNSTTNASSRSGGGGGGAGAVGTAATTGTGGNGGVGVDHSTHVGTGVGAAGWFGGGGGGGSGGTSALGVGGQGGGGTGKSGAVGHAATAGAANTGGGGGGENVTILAKDGGSGVVIVVYTPPAVPNIPTSVSVADRTHDSLTLGWSAPSGGGPVTSYDVRINGGSPVNVGLPLAFVSTPIDDLADTTPWTGAAKWPSIGAEDPATLTPTTSGADHALGLSQPSGAHAGAQHRWRATYESPVTMTGEAYLAVEWTLSAGSGAISSFGVLVNHPPDPGAFASGADPYVYAIAQYSHVTLADGWFRTLWTRGSDIASRFGFEVDGDTLQNLFIRGVSRGHFGPAYSYAFTGLTAGTTYTLEVRSVGPGGTSSWVSVTGTTVPNTYPVTQLATGARLRVWSGGVLVDVNALQV